MDFLVKHIEALLFCSAEPLTLVELEKCMAEMFGTPVPKEDVLNALSELETKYRADEFVFSLVPIADGYQFLTKPAYHPSISILLAQRSKKRLSTASLETLAIIAYKQPVTKTQVEQVRGVNCDYAIQKLLEKELLEIIGKSEGPGRPVLYGTGKKFMEYFGLKSIAELPQPKDFPAVEGLPDLPL